MPPLGAKDNFTSPSHTNFNVKLRYNKPMENPSLEPNKISSDIPLYSAIQLLSDLWKTPVQCEITDVLRDEGRNRVVRLKVTGGPVESVVLKRSMGEGESVYQQGDDVKHHPFWRFCNEWAGSEMLGPLGLGPKAITGDDAHGFFLMEDLGSDGQSTQSLADVLQGNNPDTATKALVAYAKTLGRMARLTKNKEAVWAELRAKHGGTMVSLLTNSDTLRNSLLRFVPICEALEVPLDISRFGEEINKIIAMIESPGDYLAFTPTDCCPDNHFLRGDSIIFFDNEFAKMRHALMDIAYLIVPFPTCWCANRLPDAMTDRLIAAYRAEFPTAQTDAHFETHLTLATAFWVISTMCDWGNKWIEEDDIWGIATIRQRHVLRLQNLLARPDVSTTLPTIAMTAENLLATIQTKWPDLEPMPLYPAFRQA